MLVRAECFLSICAARVAMRLFPRRTLTRAMRRRVSRPAKTNATSIAEMFARVVARHPISTNCLHRAVALHAVLVRRGIDATLHIGVRAHQPHFPGHAWVEANGVALNEDATLHDDFVPLVHR